METKKCKACGKELPLSEFGKNKSIKDGHDNKCKSCRKNCGRTLPVVSPSKV